MSALMSSLRSHPAFRWLVPASAALAVIGGGTAIGALTAATEPSLAPRGAAELLVDLQTARLDGLSGTIVARADLGLPALPGIGAARPGQAGADLSALVLGTHTLRVWYSGPDKARIALLGMLGETDVITNGTDVWIWSSRENKATHRTLPVGRGGEPSPALTGTLTPQQLADAALAAIDPSTKVTTNGSARVAGRAAHELVLEPRDGASRIGSVRLAIDAQEHVPLRVQVYPIGGDKPALEIAFTQVSFARPAAAQFVFNPPPGASVVEEGESDEANGSDKANGKDRTHGGDSGARPGTIIGKGWTSVFVTQLPEAAVGDGGQGPQAMLERIVDDLPRVSGAWGSGRLLSASLFTVLITDDRRVLVGAVTPQRLYQAAADPAARR